MDFLNESSLVIVPWRGKQYLEDWEEEGRVIRVSEVQSAEFPLWAQALTVGGVVGLGFVLVAIVGWMNLRRERTMSEAIVQSQFHGQYHPLQFDHAQTATATGAGPGSDDDAVLRSPQSLKRPPISPLLSLQGFTFGDQ